MGCNITSHEFQIQFSIERQWSPRLLLSLPVTVSNVRVTSVLRSVTLNEQTHNGTHDFLHFLIYNTRPWRFSGFSASCPGGQAVSGPRHSFLAGRTRDPWPPLLDACHRFLLPKPRCPHAVRSSRCCNDLALE